MFFHSFLVLAFSPKELLWPLASYSLMHDFNYYENCLNYCAATLHVINYQAEVRGFQYDGSLHLQARSQKYGKVYARSTTLPVIFNVQFPTNLDDTGCATVPM